MNKTAKLIRWQRITTVALLLALGTTGGSLYWHLQQADIAIVAHCPPDQKSYDQISKELDITTARLKKYEAKYGPIEPHKSGGVFITRNLNGTLIVR